DLAQGEAEARLGVGEADRAVEVAVAIHLDQREAGMLLVLRAEATVARTAVDDRGAEAERGRPRLVEAQRVEVHPRVRADQRLEPAVARAALAHDDLAVLEPDLRVDGRSADGADAAGELVEDVVRLAPARDQRATPTRRGFCRPLESPGMVLHARC